MVVDSDEEDVKNVVVDSDEEDVKNVVVDSDEEDVKNVVVDDLTMAMPLEVLDGDNNTTVVADVRARAQTIADSRD